MLAPLHAREEARLARLHSYGILDTPREARYDRLVFTIAQLVRVPIAMISFAAADRHWFKAAVGVPMREIGMESGFCPFTILEDEGLIVEDARADARFWRNPVVVGHPFVRFYAGVPLFSDDGLPVGTVCAVDIRPRKLPEGMTGRLQLLARETERLLVRTDR